MSSGPGTRRPKGSARRPGRGGAIEAAQKRASEVAASPIGKYLHRQRVEGAIQDAWEAIKFARPFGIFPYCGGDRCDACRRTGWMPHDVGTAAPEEAQARVVHR